LRVGPQAGWQAGWLAGPTDWLDSPLVFCLAGCDGLACAGLGLPVWNWFADCMVGRLAVRLAVADLDWPWLALADTGCHWLALAGSGWLWLSLAGWQAGWLGG
jgi:hypothetical protein